MEQILTALSCALPSLVNLPSGPYGQLLFLQHSNLEITYTWFMHRTNLWIDTTSTNQAWALSFMLLPSDIEWLFLLSPQGQSRGCLYHWTGKLWFVLLADSCIGNWNQASISNSGLLASTNSPHFSAEYGLNVNEWGPSVALETMSSLCFMLSFVTKWARNVGPFHTRQSLVVINVSLINGFFAPLHMMQ